MDKRIIKCAIESREFFNKLEDLVTDKDLSTFGKYIYEEVRDFYSIDPSAQAIDLGLITERLTRKYEKKADFFKEYLSSLPENVSGLNVIDELNVIRKSALADEIASGLIQKKPVEELMERYLTEKDYVTKLSGDVYEAPSLKDLVDSVRRDNLIPIYPSKLNEAIGGGVPRQSQICVYARPDVGKTTTAVNMVGGMLRAGYKVLYVGNEDPSEIVILRVLSRLTGVPRQEIATNPDKYEVIARERGYNNFVFAGLSPGTIAEIRKLVQVIEPDIMIIDQVKNLHVTKTSTVDNLEEAVEHTRNIAKEFNLVSVVVTQAGESARNKLILDLEDVYNSKTGIPGQMDLMIGVGQNQEYKDSSRLVLSFPKNKLSAPIPPITCKVDYVTNTLLVPT